MIFDNNDTIQIKSCRFFSPLEKNWWRIVGFYLDTPVTFSSELLSNKYIEISYKQYKIKIVSSEIPLRELNKNNLLFQRRNFYFLSKGTSITYTKFWNVVTINQDIITPIFKMLEFKPHSCTIDDLDSTYNKDNVQQSAFFNNNIFEEDYLLNLVRLMGAFLKRKFFLILTLI